MSARLWGSLCLQGFGGFFSGLDVGACIFLENVPIETFNISLESTENKQQYGTKMQEQEEGKKVEMIRKVIKKNWDFSDPVL